MSNCCWFVWSTINASSAVYQGYHRLHRVQNVGTTEPLGHKGLETRIECYRHRIYTQFLSFDGVEHHPDALQHPHVDVAVGLDVGGEDEANAHGVASLLVDVHGALEVVG